jgi:transcriptional regulator with XRE-family HTH domain
MARKPGPHATSDLAIYLDRRILELRHKKTQRDIATAAGFPNPNMLSMLKNGETKLAVDRVATLAAALETDPKYLLRLALDQHGNETMARVYDEILGTVMSHNELGWLEVLRDASGNSDPAVTTRARAALRAIFGK